MGINVLYEDNHLIAVEKPAGLLTQADKSRDISLMDEVKKYLKEKYKKPGKVFLGLLHRLDRPVSGIVLFAKTSKGASRLSEQFRKHKVEKIYTALVIGKPKQKRRILINYIKKDEKKNKVAVYENREEGAERAELYYETIASNDKYSLLKVQLKTGKPHQIRSQLSFIGCPIVGDVKYDAPFLLPGKNIALSANFLSFNTATGDKKIEISIPIPVDWKEYIEIGSSKKSMIY
jgi:23S rRNA pseudouridine1911/1915/1917 synthase